MEGHRFRNIRNVEMLRERAALGSRIGATILDYLVLSAYLGAVFLFPQTRDLVFSSSALLILFIMPAFLYHLLCEVFFDGRSAGKYAMGTRVMRTDGTSPTIGNYLLRWILRLLDFMLFGFSVGMLSIVLTEKGQRIGDIAAGTLVVKDRPTPSIREIWGAPDPNAKVTFEEAAFLSDQEIALLQEALNRWHHAQEPLRGLLQRIVERLGIRDDRSPDHLARTLIRDHDQLFREGRAG
jgi:uncharacterized RDD family membrane protein YckC